MFLSDFVVLLHCQDLKLNGLHLCLTAFNLSVFCFVQPESVVFSLDFGQRSGLFLFLNEK